MNRRRLLQAAMAGTAGLAVPRAVRSQDPYWACYFDGNCVIQNNGNIPTLPAASNQFFGNFGFARSTPPSGPMYILYMGYPRGSGGTYLAIQMAPVIGPPNYTILQASIVPQMENCPTNTGPCYSAHVTVDPYLDGNVHQVLVSMNATNYSAAFTIDGQVQSTTIVECQCTFSGAGIDYYGNPIYIGGQPFGHSTNWVGTLDTVLLYAGMSISASDPNVIAAFWNASKGVPHFFDPTYQWCLGVSPQYIPQAALAGPPSQFMANEPSSIGHFTLTTDNPQNPFSYISGSSVLQPATEDYYNQPGMGAAAVTRRPTGRYTGPPVPVRLAKPPHLRHHPPG